MFQLLKSGIRDAITQMGALPGTVPADPDRLQAGSRDAGTLSEAFLNGPVYASLREDLRTRKPALDPSGYGFLRTLGERAMMTDEQIHMVQSAYAGQIRKYGTFLSGENEIHGWKRVAILGPGIKPPDPARLEKPGSYRIFLVDAEGHLRTGSLEGELPDNLSVAEVMDRVLADPGSIPQAGSFNLNPFSHSFRNSCYGAAYNLQESSVFGLFRHSAPQVRVDGEDIDLPFEENDARIRAQHQFSQILASLTVKRMQVSMRNVAAGLRSAIDPEIMRIMRSTHMMETIEAEWLSASGKDRDVSTARVQACRTYPALARHICEFGDLRRAVDNRTPLVPVIADVFQIPESGVRNLTGLTWQKVGAGSTVSSDTIRMVGRISRDHAPSNRKEFAMLRSIVNLSEIAQTGFDETFSRFCEGGSPWRHAEAMAKTPVSDVHDFISYMSNRLYIPATLRRIRDTHQGEDAGRVIAPTFSRIGEDPLVRFLGEVGIKDLLNGSDRWHRNLQRHEDRISTIDRKNVWRPLVGTQMLGDIRVRELDSSRRLKTQGMMEEHCVGGYDGAVMRSNLKNATVIFSIEKGGRILSTLELRLAGKPARKKDGIEISPVTIGDGWSVSIAQSRSKSNGTPGKAAEAAARNLVAHISGMSAETMTSWVEDMAVTRRKAVSSNRLPEAIKTAGFNIWDDLQMQTAWDELSAYLPRRMRKAGLDAFVESMDSSMPRLLLSAMKTENPPFWTCQDRMARAVIAGESPDDTDVRGSNISYQVMASAVFEDGNGPFPEEASDEDCPIPF